MLLKDIISEHVPSL